MKSRRRGPTASLPALPYLHALLESALRAADYPRKRVLCGERTENCLSSSFSDLGLHKLFFARRGPALEKAMPSGLYPGYWWCTSRASIPVRATSSCARLVRKLDVS